MSIYHLPTYSSLPWNSKWVLRSELWQAEISSASVKSLVNPSCNRADRVYSSDQKGSISNPPLHSAHTPFQLLQAWQHLLPRVSEQFYFCSPVILWFYDILRPSTPCQQLPAFQYCTWNVNWKDEAAFAPSLPADCPSCRPAPQKEAGLSLELKPKDKKKKKGDWGYTNPSKCFPLKMPGNMQPSPERWSNSVLQAWRNNVKGLSAGNCLTQNQGPPKNSGS